MERKRLFWQKYSGQLLLVILILLLLVGWRALLADEFVADNGEGTAVSPTLTTPTIGAADRNRAEKEPLSELPVIEDASLSPALNPLTYQPKLPEHVFQTYTVQRGDTPKSIADQFGIESETLLGGNPFLSQESSLLQTGLDLIILPVDGVLHDVLPGETLEKLAEQFGVPMADIIAYAPNNLEFPYRLQPDTQIVIPGAVRELFIWNPPTLAEVTGRRSSGIGSGVQPVVRGTGTFVWPVISRYFTQYYWAGHRAIDVALPEGSAAVAADTGTVTYAGWNNTGYGYLIVVNHGNGYETFYAHLRGVNVAVGQVVVQGQVIGATGNTGNSSGPHIHFEVRSNGNRDDPCWYIPC